MSCLVWFPPPVRLGDSIGDVDLLAPTGTDLMTCMDRSARRISMSPAW
jgi:hypothetical protein